jgi:hypothetical protein
MICRLRRSSLLLIAIGVIQSACVGSCDLYSPRRHLVGDYWLWRAEVRYFYLEKGSSYDSSGAGVARGAVQEIAWREDVIAVKRAPLPGEQSPAWPVINVREGAISGPLAQAEWERLRAETPELARLRLRPVSEVWETIGGG